MGMSRYEVLEKISLKNWFFLFELINYLNNISFNREGFLTSYFSKKLSTNYSLISAKDLNYQLVGSLLLSINKLFTPKKNSSKVIIL
jgi:hypothetical protein